MSFLAILTFEVSHNNVYLFIYLYSYLQLVINNFYELVFFQMLLKNFVDYFGIKHWIFDKKNGYLWKTQKYTAARELPEEIRMYYIFFKLVCRA